MNSVDFDLFLSGEWMNSSAGLAFAPHVIRVGAGEVCSLFHFGEKMHSGEVIDNYCQF